jgi:hypothetical protein
MPTGCSRERPIGNNGTLMGGYGPGVSRLRAGSAEAAAAIERVSITDYPAHPSVASFGLTRPGLLRISSDMTFSAERRRFGRKVHADIEAFTGSPRAGRHDTRDEQHQAKDLKRCPSMTWSASAARRWAPPGPHARSPGQRGRWVLTPDRLGSGTMHDPTSRSRCRRKLLRRPRWLLTRERGNGLGDDAWVPVMFISRRIISAVLAELGRAGVPAYCSRFNPAWCGIPARWCLWVGRSANGRAEERLTELMLGLFGDLDSGPSAALPR